MTLNPFQLQFSLSLQHLSVHSAPSPLPSGLLTLFRWQKREPHAWGEPTARCGPPGGALLRLGEAEASLAEWTEGKGRVPTALPVGAPDWHRKSASAPSNSLAIRPKDFLKDSLLSPEKEEGLRIVLPAP